MRSLRPVVVLVVALGGCPGPFEREPYCRSLGPAAPSSADGPSFEGFCDALAETACDTWRVCGCPGADLATCPDDVVATCEAFVANAEVGDALTRGTLVWQPGEAAELLAAIEAARIDCVPPVLDASALARGTLENYRACTDVSGGFSECIDGSSCQTWCLSFECERSPSGRNCLPDPVADPFQAEGEPCVASCGFGLRCAPPCDGETPRCAPRLPTGSDCRAAVDCTTGLCHQTAPGADGRCVEPGSAAEGADCVDDRECSTGLCHQPTDALGTCIAVGSLADGEACTDSRACASTLCVPEPADPTMQTCRSPLPDGAACTFALECASLSCLAGVCTSRAPRADGSPCEVAGECASGACLDGRCVPLRPDGAACTMDAVCEGGRCNGSGVCGRYAEVGEPCTTASECRSFSCSGGVCLAPGTIGATCGVFGDLACESRTCFDGLVCAPAICGLTLDPTGHGTFWRMPPSFRPSVLP